MIGNMGILRVPFGRSGAGSAGLGDVSRDLQRLLIKAIEEKVYFPLRDDRPRESDFQAPVCDQRRG